MNISIGGVLFVMMNIGVEFGFGGVIVVFLGFVIMRDGIFVIFINLLVNGVVMTNILVGIIGLVLGGMGIVLSVMGDKFIVVVN